MDQTPRDVLDAVEKGTLDGVNALTIEFTPYDPSGRVCYVNNYAMSNPEEDRAETFSKFYIHYYRGETPALYTDNAVLKNKILHWDKMIRATFGLPSSVSLPFDALN